MIFYILPVAKLRQRLITSGIRVFSSNRNLTSAIEALLLKCEEVKSHLKVRRSTWTSDIRYFSHQRQNRDSKFFRNVTVALLARDLDSKKGQHITSPS